MKAVILLAGKGKRIEKKGLLHKSLIKLEGETLLSYIIQNIIKAGIEEIVPIVGYHGEKVLEEVERVKKNLKVYPIWNKRYDETNNLYSLYQARNLLSQETFITINGDMVFDYHILERLLRNDESEIAIDNLRSKVLIDSPGVIIENGRVMDLGRHITEENRGGYAVGIYKYGKDLVMDFFDLAAQMLENNLNHGFHDPLRGLFDKHVVKMCSVQSYKWTDIDEEGDITIALEILKGIKRDNDI